jgi:hypothetical protein
MPSPKLSREQFEERYHERFRDPAFEPLAVEIASITAAAWDAYSHSRKAPQTRKAGPGFAHPDYDLSVDWIAARDAIHAAQSRHDDESGSTASFSSTARHEASTPADMSKSYPLIDIARKEIELAGWDFPRHLAGRLFSVVVHGDTEGADGDPDRIAQRCTDAPRLRPQEPRRPVGHGRRRSQAAASEVITSTG